jgi:hypothetical protein
MKLSLVPLLLGGKMLSPEARHALKENRRSDAAVLLMQEYDLDCREAGDQETDGQPGLRIRDS